MPRRLSRRLSACALALRLTAAAALFPAALGCDDRGKPKTAALHAVGLRTEAMNYHAAEQRSANWCWAACIQMLLSTQGAEVAQEEVVRQAFGDLVDAPANFDTIAANLNAWTFDHGGRRVRLNATIGVGPPPTEVLLKCLAGNTPVIVGCPVGRGPVGHAVVITAAVYQDAADGPQVLSVLVRDPAYAVDEGKRKLSAEEYAAVERYFLVSEIAAR